MTTGTCKDCGEVECPKDAMGLHIGYLAIDFSCHPWRTTLSASVVTKRT